MDLYTLTITEARKLLKEKKISSVDLVISCLNRIKKLEQLNAFITVCEEQALQEAKKADERISLAEDLPLLGVPISLKDMYLTKGIKTTAGSKVLETYIPQYSATAVEKLQQAGAIIIGKNNQDAWAHGSSGENSDFGPTKSPWNTEYIPGGSSSGPAVAVATDMVLGSMGTDTGGSIRQPASLCNVVGLKPTYGRVSRYGVVAMASSFDTMGHLTKTVEDSAVILSVTAGKDEKDATSSSLAIDSYTKDLKKGIKGIKIGVPKEYFIKGLDPKIENCIKQALKKYESLGAELIEISLPHTEYAIGCYYILMTAEVSSNLARYDGIRYGNDRSAFGAEAKRRIMLGTFTLSVGYYDAFYKKGLKIRTLMKKDFENAFKKVDIIAAPVSPTLPWKIGEKVNDPLAMYLSDIFTVTGNIAGIPGLAIPAGFVDDFPVGMQLFGPYFSEKLLFNAGYQYEQVTNWRKYKPKL